MFNAPSKQRFAVFAQDWLTARELSIKPLTYRRYEGLLRVHLLPVFGSQSISKITVPKIQTLLTKLVRDKGVSPNTANHVLALLKVMLTYACKWKLLLDNPCQYVDRLRVPHTEMQYLTPPEIQLLLQFAKEPYRSMFLTAVLTGVRSGELHALQWNDIDWDTQTIYVQRALYTLSKQERESEGLDIQSGWRFTDPKSKHSIRRIVLSQTLCDALQAHRLTAPVSQHDLIFCTPEGNPIKHEHVYRQQFLPTLTRAGLRKIRFHDLRHTYAALLIAQGEHVKFIQNQMGHESPEFTLRRYGHLFPDAGSGVGDRLDAQVFGAAQANSSTASSSPSH